MAGRPKFEPTEVDRHLVKTMARTGVPHTTIARCLGKNGIDEKTLRRHFRRELDVSADIANAMIAGVLYSAALKGEPWAVCFWLKCQAGWKEKQQVEHSGPNDGGITLVVRSVLQPAEEVE
ncbi:MAG TPA: hypothetical protein VNH18_05560 [Bryobacteraceae bacterium]|nr:hypothetical protein [Bryobacteraceae bacterium]HXJ38722.1 hypothetical protein [Bryobacteraceae bacterium]